MKRPTTDELIELYKETFFKYHGKYPKITRKGGWLYINNSFTAHRPHKLKEFIGNLERQAEQRDNKPEPEPKDEPEDIRALISAIRQDGRHIFRSHDLKQMQRAGNRIAKMAKRILNILDEEQC